MDYKYILNNFKYFITSSIFKIMYIIYIILCIMHLNSTKVMEYNFRYSFNYFEYLLNLMSNYSFIIVNLFITILISTLFIYHRFEKNLNYIIRCENKKKYLKEISANIFIINTIIYLILILTLAILTNFSSVNYNIKEYYSYNIPNVIYLLFLIIKYYVLIMIISLLNIYLIKLINEKIVIFLNIVIYGLTFIAANPVLVNNILEMPFLITSYIGNAQYSNFNLEMTCHFIFYLCLTIITTIIFIISSNNIRQIGD